MVTSVHNITYLLSLFRCMVAFLTCPPSCPAAALHELDVLHCQDRWHRCYWLVLGIGMGPVSSFLASCSHVWCFEYQPVIPVIDHCSCHSKLIILADHRRHLSQTLGRPLCSPWLFWHTWTLVDICGHLSAFVMYPHGEVERPMDSQVSTQLVFEYLCGMGEEGTQFVIRKLTSANPNPRDDLREFLADDFSTFVNILWIITENVFSMWSISINLLMFLFGCGYWCCSLFYSIAIAG